MQFLRPGALPLVRLDAGSFHSNQYGDIACPAFTVTGWVTDKGQPYPAIGQAPSNNGGTGGTALPKGTLNDALDDDIPI
jgi:hypothetical protein